MQGSRIQAELQGFDVPPLQPQTTRAFFIMGLSCAMQAQAVSDLPGLCEPWMGWLCLAVWLPCIWRCSTA